MKISINVCHGGFNVTRAVYDELGIDWDECGFLSNDSFGIESDNRHEYRADPRLIAAIEKLGRNRSSGPCAHIKIIDIPDKAKWLIENHDGLEAIHEFHRIWR